jgi:hypothetical protein
MRLIDATLLELCSFMDESQLPPYAILSHTWGVDEVTLEQLNHVLTREDHRSTSVKESHGFWKITQACQQALLDGLAYVWVDTCCIDKSSSAELSEAINSMFRWYQNAEVCYAYLDDVQVALEPGVDGVLLSDERFSEEELASSRWFTRGWTLQELVAPNDVVFYGKGWKYIDTKTWLRESLEHITGISANVLWDSGQLEEESIAQRMSWMARRQTTRVEDLAYSLMGIFDVNMPLLYGEGEKAFTRLQEEIMKDSADHTLFAWNALPSDSFRTGEVHLSSVFATHPSQFAHSTGFSRRRFDDEESTGESYALTNMGVRVNLRLKPYRLPKSDDDIFVAMLDCWYQDTTSLRKCRPAIFIQRLSADRPQFVRIANAGIVPVGPRATRQLRLLHNTITKINEALARMGVVYSGEGFTTTTVYLRKRIPGWVRTNLPDTTAQTRPNLNRPY